jgi:hypothetical protein
MIHLTRDVVVVTSGLRNLEEAAIRAWRDRTGASSLRVPGLFVAYLGAGGILELVTRAGRSAGMGITNGIHSLSPRDRSAST